MGKAARKKKQRRNRKGATVFETAMSRGTTPAEVHRQIVARYFLARSVIKAQSLKDRTPEDKRIDRIYQDSLANAVIYEIPEELYKSIYRAADFYTATEVAGLPWYDVDARPNDPPEEIKEQMPHYWESLATEGKKQPYPNKFPFADCYFGFHHPPVMTEQQKVTYDVQTRYAIKVGMLVTQAGNVWTLILGSDSRALVGDYRELENLNGEVAFHFSAYPERLYGKWTHPLTLAPWVVPALVEWVNDHKVVTVEQVPRTLSYKRMCQREGKRRGNLKRPIPPPYYAVTMRDQLILEEDYQRRFPKRRASIDWQHQWLVTGHDRIRVKRGPLPMPEKIEAKLRKPRRSGSSYLIFKDSHPQGELAKQLWRRGVKPKQADEWMAVLVSRVGDYVKGPADKPLIPSTRRSGRNRPFTP
jgi:hypothetical protein